MSILKKSTLNRTTTWIQKGQENKVCRFKKALYGLKQTPRAWNTRIDEYFYKNGFVKSSYEHSLYAMKN